MVFGDSIALGAEASGRDQTFVGIIASRLGSSVTYFCRGGATSETGAEWCDFVWSVPPPDLVIVSYGMNDQTLVGRSFRRRVQVAPDEYKQNVLRIVRSVRRRGAGRVLLVAPPPPHPDWEGDSGRTLEYRDVLSDCGEPVADVPSRWGDSRNLIANGMNHPGDDGHRVIAEACLAALDGITQSRS